MKEWVTRNIDGKKQKVLLEKTHVAFYEESLAEEVNISSEGNMDATYRFKMDVKGVTQTLTFMAWLHGKVRA